MWIDTHCHLDAPEFDTDRDAVAQRARAAGVQALVLPAVCPGNFDAVRELAHRHGGAYALGIHPLFVEQAVRQVGGAGVEAAIAAVADALQRYRDDPRLVAVGEIGLDFFVDGLDRAAMARCFEAQLDLAQQHGLPVILHSRRAVDGVLKQLRRRPGLRGIAHAFNGSEQQAQVLVELGLRIGFGGALTFDRALQIRRLAATLPLEALVLETDAPDIPPHWLYLNAEQRAAGARSRNEPAELPRIAGELAALRGLTPAELAQATRANAVAALPRLGALLASGAANAAPANGAWAEAPPAVMAPADRAQQGG
jgi:TatD DNase family protein